jgi:hypothetical protein
LLVGLGGWVGLGLELWDGDVGGVIKRRGSGSGMKGEGDKGGGGKRGA